MANAVFPRQKLSPREIEILQLTALGNTDLEIAEQLGGSPFTIKGHQEAIRIKLEARNRAHSTFLGCKGGILLDSEKVEL